MQKMYWVILPLFIISIFGFSPNIACAGQGTPFNDIIFFGDSLSDNGNLYYTDFGFLPKSQPYYLGRFSNGPVWSEHIADFFNKQRKITSVNYAFGGESAIFHNPMHGYLPYSLTLSLDSYLFRNMFYDKSHTLFIIWMGANDYLPGSASDPDSISTSVVNTIRNTMVSLMYHGGKNFLIINLPDLSRTPFGQLSEKGDFLRAVSEYHNAKLEAVVSQLQAENQDANIHLFKANAIFEELINNPATFNAKYDMQLTNSQSACWQGGYMLQGRQAATADNIAKALQAQMNSHVLSAPTENRAIDILGFATYVANSPGLTEAYNVNQSAENNGQPCTNPDAYVFWDHLHPTAVVHRMMSTIMIDFITQNFQVGSGNKIIGE